MKGGGQGTVYKVAEPNASEEEYALKFLHKQRDQERLKHVKEKNNVEVSKKDLISIIKRYCDEEALLYDPRVEELIRE